MNYVKLWILEASARHWLLSVSDRQEPIYWYCQPGLLNKSDVVLNCFAHDILIVMAFLSFYQAMLVDYFIFFFFLNQMVKSLLKSNSEVLKEFQESDFTKILSVLQDI